MSAEVVRVTAADLPEAFKPFEGGARDELTTHVGLVRDLGDSTFLRRGRLSWDLPLHNPLSGPRSASDDALDAVVPILRQLWWSKTWGGFHRVRDLLRDHLRETAEGDRAKRLLDAAADEHSRILTASAYGAVMEEQVDEHGYSAGSRTVAPGEVFRDYVNGHLMHRDDPRKRERLDGWTGFHKMAFIDAASSLGTLYRRFGLGAVLVLREPSLHR